MWFVRCVGVLSIWVSVFFSFAVRAAPGDPPVTARVEQAVVEGARKQGQELRADPRLGAAAADLVRLCTDEGPPPGSEIIAEALNLHGVVEPSPHLVLVSYTNGDEEGLLRELRQRLPEVLSQGRFRLAGAGAVPISDSRTRVLVLLLESFIDLEPPPRAVPMPDHRPRSVPIRGALLSPYTRPEVLITDPRGQVARVALAADDKGKDRFAGLFHCLEKGRYQLEILAEDKRGSTVLANFPVYCGEKAPRALAATAEQREAPFKDEKDAEQQLLALLQADRARYGLPRLLWNPRLAEVARAHSKEMMELGAVAHVSPRTGDASSRVRRAGLLAPVLLENLARAYSPLEAERGLMDSPGHRANVLNRVVTEAGIGVQIGKVGNGPDAVRELWVTQLFLRPPEPFDPVRTPQLALARVQQLRHDAQQPPLRQDPTLMELAAQTAEALSQGRLPEDRVGEPVQAALQKLSGHFRVVRTVLALATDVRQLSPSPALLDAAASDLGLAAAPVPVSGERGKQAGGAVYVVIVVGQRPNGRAAAH